MGSYEDELAIIAAGADPGDRIIGPGDASRAWLQNVWGNLLGGEIGAPGLPLNAHSIGAANKLIVKAGAGVLFGFTVATSLAGGQFIQLHDALGGFPAANAVPVWTAPISGYVQASGTGLLAVSFIFPGRFFERGIYIVNSTAQNTYVAGAADSFFDAQFI
jgi:hypothetical protein